MKNLRPTQKRKTRSKNVLPLQSSISPTNTPVSRKFIKSRNKQKISWTDGMQKTWNRCICRDAFVHELFFEDYERDIKEVTTAQPMVKSNLGNRGWPGRGFIQGNRPRCHRAWKILWQCQGWTSHVTLRSSRSLRLICSTLIYDLLVAWIGRVVLQLN
jgi:hypothetical protein